MLCEDGSKMAFCNSEQPLWTSVDVGDCELIVQWCFISMWALNMHELGAQWEKKQVGLFYLFTMALGNVPKLLKKANCLFFFLTSNLSHSHFLQLHSARGSVILPITPSNVLLCLNVKWKIFEFPIHQRTSDFRFVCYCGGQNFPSIWSECRTVRWVLETGPLMGFYKLTFLKKITFL